MIDNFEDKYFFLSNFYPVRIEYEGLTYPSVEHAYQAAKSISPMERWDVATTKSAGAAKKKGRTLTLRKDWEDKRISIMHTLLRLKFNQEPFRKLLLETKNQELIEGNYWNDTFWGVCHGIGENHLGKLLMSVREELQSNTKEHEYVRS